MHEETKRYKPQEYYEWCLKSSTVRWAMGEDVKFYHTYTA